MITTKNYNLYKVNTSITVYMYCSNMQVYIVSRKSRPTEMSIIPVSDSLFSEEEHSGIPKC